MTLSPSGLASSWAMSKAQKQCQTRVQRMHLHTGVHVLIREAIKSAAASHNITSHHRSHNHSAFSVRYFTRRTCVCSCCKNTPQWCQLMSQRTHRCRYW